MSDSKLQEEMKFEGYGKRQKWSFGMASFAQFFINSAFNTWVFSLMSSSETGNRLTIISGAII